MFVIFVTKVNVDKFIERFNEFLDSGAPSPLSHVSEPTTPEKSVAVQKVVDIRETGAVGQATALSKVELKNDVQEGTSLENILINQNF